jgi:hypothetical protein
LIVIAMALWSLHANWRTRAKRAAAVHARAQRVDLAHILGAMAVVSAVREA